jgi:8-oxo-dGTP pyrophosphatase MutT (NUDIX family)
MEAQSYAHPRPADADSVLSTPRAGYGRLVPSARVGIPTWFFALVVVRLGARFLLVHERKHGQGWYLPAGRVEPGETLTDGALRETLEETGVPVRLEGILRIEHSPDPSGSARCRVFFLASPVDNRPPRTVPDDESLGAAWIALDELHRYPLRGEEVREILTYVSAGGPVYPLSLLAPESAPWRQARR